MRVSGIAGVAGALPGWPEFAAPSGGAALGFSCVAPGEDVWLAVLTGFFADAVAVPALPDFWLAPAERAVLAFGEGVDGVALG